MAPASSPVVVHDGVHVREGAERDVGHHDREHDRTAALGLDVANQRPDCEGPHPLGATAAWAPP